jgi:septal ring factor EnvC (AmiA/AmiB activator)
MKPGCLLLCLSVFSGAICAEQTDSCAGLQGSDLSQCRSNQQTVRLQERLEQQLQQQQERQNQLDNQQREVKQQLESLRLQNESLRKQLEHEAANQAARPVATVAMDASKSADVKTWKAQNPWFGSDYARTQFAMRYVKQLQQERPELGGRELLDALSMKVDETFGAKR